MTDKMTDKWNELKWCANPRARAKGVRRTDTAAFSREAAERARAFHESLPAYGRTPLHALDRLAASLGVARVFVKDESPRFGLKAFKALGASYAAALAVKAARESGVVPDACKTPPVSPRPAAFGGLATATDGNHGRAVAWYARQAGLKCTVFMPRDASDARVGNIRSEGADVRVIDGDYDDAVKAAAAFAGKEDWLLIQDTAFEGYEKTPLHIMQGYLTLFEEAFAQLQGEIPTHVFIQCGVGSLAAALQAFLVERFGDARPLLTVVEPTRAACFYESAVSGTGKPRKASGDLSTIMAGLACGEPSLSAWRILWDYADVFTACPDPVAALGMRVLGNPVDPDPRVISGESGAAPLGLLAAAMAGSAPEGLKAALGLDRDARVLVFSTEGDTDPGMYRKIVWQGLYPYPAS